MLNNGNCGSCDRQCLQCTGPLATDCEPDQCVNVYAEAKGCTTACPLDHYVKLVDLRPSQARRYKVCEKCHPSCDASKGCVGGSAAQCNKCSGYEIQQAAGGEEAGCRTSCPDQWFASKDKICTRCDKGCRFGCNGEGATNCQLSNAFPEEGEVKLTTTALLVNGNSLVINGALSDMLRRTLARVMDISSENVAIPSILPGSGAGEAGALKVTFRVTANEDARDMAIRALKTAIPQDVCANPAKCLITELRFNRDDFKPVSVFRRATVTVQTHVSKCADQYVVRGNACRESCGDGYFQKPGTNKCGTCDKCLHCTGPSPSDCLGECLLKNQDGSCAKSCTVDQYLSPEKVCKQCNSLCARNGVLAGGCRGPGPNECSTCAKFEFQGTCYETCPGATVRGQCISTCPRFLSSTGDCIEACPESTLVNAQRVCEPCSGDCYKGCSAPDDATKCTPTLVTQDGKQFGRKCKGALSTAIGGASQTCVPLCQPGYYFRNQGTLPKLSAKGGYECRPCDTGYQCQDGEVKEPCPLTTYTDKRGSVECKECPPNAVCQFNWDKGARDTFYCKAGYVKDLTGVRCITGEDAAAAKNTKDDKDSLIMIGIVAGCIALLSIVTAIFCVMSNREGPGSGSLDMSAYHPNSGINAVNTSRSLSLQSSPTQSSL